ncbi:GCFC domain-containing protein [Aphelenchoides besseyi]|nr:GCFC domain-containing protein [Aphelenchoides besseyi]KAI6193140.1 GCFC domain-containing protein [Aphelenchoides besseyi]
MFRKPKNRNIRQRQKLDDESNAESASATSIATESKIVEEPSTIQVPSSKTTPLLSFDEPEADTEFVRIKSRSSDSDERLRRNLKKRSKNRDVGYPLAEDEMEVDNDEVQILGETKNGNFEENRRRKPVNLEILDEEVVTRRRKSVTFDDGDQHEEIIIEEVKKVQSSIIEISDAKAVYEARKKREMMRATGAGIQPAIPLAEDTKSVEDRYAQRSRLVREDENDLSDEENPNFITTKDLLYNEEMKRRDEQLEALHVEQGDSGDEEAIHSDDDNWEQEQIRRAVSRRRVAELKDERTNHQRVYHNQGSLADFDGDRMVDKEMEIEIISQSNQQPSFIEPDGTLKKTQKYTSMNEVLEKLQISISNRREAIATKEHEIEQHGHYIEDNRESIRKMTEANFGLERNFQLFQEMRFFINNVLNCLNEKISVINEVETAMFEIWRLRADDLTRRRSEHRTRRRYERFRQVEDGWNSETEESIQPNTKSMEPIVTLFDDTANEYCDVGLIIRRFIDWYQTDRTSFTDAYIAECMPKVLGPFVRLELLNWNPLLPKNQALKTMKWYQAVLKLGFNNEGFDPTDDPVILALIPDVIEKIVIPKLTKILNEQWDPFSLIQTKQLVEQIDEFVCFGPNLNRKSKIFMKLLNSMQNRAQAALKNESSIPEHLTSIVTEIKREKPPAKKTDFDDMQSLMAQAKSIMR